MSDQKHQKPKSHTLYKPNGKEVKVNDDSLEYAKSFGWTEHKPKSGKK